MESTTPAPADARKGSNVQLEGSVTRHHQPGNEVALPATAPEVPSTPAGGNSGTPTVANTLNSTGEISRLFEEEAQAMWEAMLTPPRRRRRCHSVSGPMYDESEMFEYRANEMFRQTFGSTFVVPHPAPLNIVNTLTASMNRSSSDSSSFKIVSGETLVVYPTAKTPNQSLESRLSTPPASPDAVQDSAPIVPAIQQIPVASIEMNEAAQSSLTLSLESSEIATPPASPEVEAPTPAPLVPVVSSVPHRDVYLRELIAQSPNLSVIVEESSTVASASMASEAGENMEHASLEISNESSANVFETPPASPDAQIIPSQPAAVVPPVGRPRHNIYLRELIVQSPDLSVVIEEPSVLNDTSINGESSDATAVETSPVASESVVETHDISKRKRAYDGSGNDAEPAAKRRKIADRETATVSSRLVSRLHQINAERRQEAVDAIVNESSVEAMEVDGSSYLAQFQEVNQHLAPVEPMEVDGSSFFFCCSKEERCVDNAK